MKRTQHLLGVAATDASSSSNVKFLESLLSGNRGTKALTYLSELCTSVRPVHADNAHGQPVIGTPSRVTRSQSSSAANSIRQASAKLSCLRGLPGSGATGDWDGPDPSKLRGRARSKTYNMRNYHDENEWGPFKNDGTKTADWEKLEAILYQVLLGVSRSASGEQTEGKAMIHLWNTPFAGVTPNSFRSPPPLTNAEAPSLHNGVDPYGIEGTWDRIVCFLDYGDFYRFNFYDPYNLRPEPRDPIDTEETVILIRMKLRVTSIEPDNTDNKQNLPVVHFRGTSSLLPPFGDPNTGSGIRGQI